MLLYWQSRPPSLCCSQCPHWQGAWIDSEDCWINTELGREELQCIEQSIFLNHLYWINNQHMISSTSTYVICQIKKNKKLSSENKHDNLFKPLSFITNQNKIKCSNVLLFVDSGPQLFALSWGWELESGKWIPVPGQRLAGTGQRHKHETTLNVISGSLGTLRGTQRPFMHVHTGNDIWLCAHRYQQLPFLLCEYFKSYFGTACSVHLKHWFSST